MPKRRGRGEGSVTPLPDGAGFRARGSYVAPDGKRKRPSRNFEKRADAYAWLRSIGCEVKDLAAGTGEKTVGDWLDVWLPLHRAAAAPSNYDRDRQVVETHVRRRWAGVKLRDVTKLAVRLWLADLKAAGVSDSEVHRAGGTLRKIVNSAAENGQAKEAALAGLRLPQVEREEKRPFDPDQLAAVLAAAEARPPLRAMCLVQLDGCLRPQELLGLSAGDYDPTAGKLRVRRALDGKTGELKKLKNKWSRRDIPLTETTRAALAELPPRPGPEAPLWLNRAGGRMLYQNWFYSYLKPACVAAGCPWAAGYTLRHTGASFLNAAGQNVLVIARRLGHKNANMTLAVYLHLFADDQDNATAALENLLRKTGISGAGKGP